MPLSQDLRDQIDKTIRSERVVLFMKGTRSMPQCGFSAQVVGILNELVDQYQTIDVLSNPMLRDGIKEFSNWPTIPQLYIDGQFVGGCDIVKEMHAAGDLHKMLGVSEAAVETPSIQITEAAKAALLEASGDVEPNEVLHLEISPKFQYGLFFGPKAKGEIEADAGGITIYLDKTSAKRAGGTVIDFVDGPSGAAGFKIQNPNEPARAKPLSARELKAMMDRGANFRLYDVRTDAERELAILPNTLVLSGNAQLELETTEDKHLTLVFYCHHGIRSAAACERALSLGFKNVYNLSGGIEAWSQTVDASVPRY